MFSKKINPDDLNITIARSEIVWIICGGVEEGRSNRYNRNILIKESISTFYPFIAAGWGGISLERDGVCHV
jgi:hypothetical protein